MTFTITNIGDRSPKARIKYEAEQAEVKLKRDVFEGKYGKQFVTMLFADFVGNRDAKDGCFAESTFLEWAKHNKRGNMIASGCGFSCKRSGARRWAKSNPWQSKDSRTADGSLSRSGKNNAARRPVNHELDLLSRIFSLAIR